MVEPFAGCFRTVLERVTNDAQARPVGTPVGTSGLPLFAIPEEADDDRLELVGRGPPAPPANGLLQPHPADDR